MNRERFQGAFTINLTYRNERERLPLLHSHHTYEIYYFYSGNCRFLVGGREYALLPGDLLLLDGMSLHTVISEHNRPYLRSVIHFQPEFVESLMNGAILRDTMLPFRGPLLEHIRLEERQQSEVESILERMYQLSLSELPLARERYALAFMDLLYYISAQYHSLQRPNSIGPSEKMRHVQQIVAFLNKSYMEDLHMGRLERELHLSKTYMASLFKEITGTTLFQYVRHLRLNKAKLLFISEQQLSVADVCFRVGYKHPSHFSRLFKQHFGVPPEAYRRDPSEIRSG